MTLPTKELEKSIKRLELFASVMESKWRIPLTRLTFGLDFVLGLVPILGDFITGLFSLWLVKESLKFKLPKRVYIKMLLNVLLDFMVGSIPLIGDGFDLVFKANKRNLNLVLESLHRTIEK